MSINQSKNMPFDIFGKIVFINEYLNGGETANKSFFKKALRFKKKKSFHLRKNEYIISGLIKD